GSEQLVFASREGGTKIHEVAVDRSLDASCLDEGSQYIEASQQGLVGRIGIEKENDPFHTVAMESVQQALSPLAGVLQGRTIRGQGIWASNQGICSADVEHDEARRPFHGCSVVLTE